MTEFKLCIADTKTGRSFKKDVKDNEADFFIGKNIGESITGDSIGIPVAELIITGGSDKSGFPMRRGILDVRKKLNLLGGVGIRERFSNGIKKKKTVCGHKINPNIIQINLKVSKPGEKSLADIFPDQLKAKEEIKEAKK